MKEKIRKGFWDRFGNLKKPYILFEVLVVIVVSFLVGYFVNPEDPLLVNDVRFNYFYLVMMIVALFYGLGVGLLILVVYTAIASLFVGEFPTEFFLNGLLIALISGEFNYYWSRKIDNIHSKALYLEDKVREIGISSLTIKLSHDQLEKSYLSKPYTIRGVLSKISEDMNLDEFLKFISSQFFVNKLAVVFMEEDKSKIKEVVYSGFEEKIDLKEPIIEKMLFLKDIVYVKDILDLKEAPKYLAAIPVLNFKDEIFAFILIKDMPFIHYNKENLLAIQLLSHYFFWRVNKLEEAFKVPNEFLTILPLEDRYEVYKLKKLKERVGIESCVILLKTDKDSSKIIENFLNAGLRTLDFYSKVSLRSFDVFFIVLPFVGKEGGFGFVNRVFGIFDFLDEKNKYFVFSIDEVSSLPNIIRKVLSKNED